MPNSPQNFSPPETLYFTHFESRKNSTGILMQIKYANFQAHLSNSNWIRDDKQDLPMIKLAYFENNQRSNNTLRTLHGIECDYDAEKHSPEHAVSILNAVGVEAVICTTSSHTPAKPRFRIFCPFSKPQQPQHHEHFVTLIDGFLGNILAKESYTASQSYYIGSVAQGHPVQVYHSSGVCIDALPPSETRHQNLIEQSGRRKFTVLNGKKAPSYEVALRALQSKDPNELDRNEWLLFSGAFFIATSNDPRAKQDWQRWNERYGT